MPFLERWKWNSIFECLISDENILVCKHESRAYMKAKHTSIKKPNVFADPMSIFSGNGSNTPYTTAGTIDEVIKLLEHESIMLFQWLSNKQMKVNISKCHLLVNKKDKVFINLKESEIKNSEYEKLLGIKDDIKLNFNGYLNDIISKLAAKLILCQELCPIRVYLRRRC